MTILELRDVHRVHGHGETEVHALNGVTLSVQPAELVAVMGRPAPASPRCSTWLVAWTARAPAR